MPKRVLITGGTGALGRALVRRFREEGHAVAFTFRRDAAAATSLAAEASATPILADLTDGAQVKGAVGQALATLGGLDVLVNNAGGTQVLPFALIEEEDWDEVLAANLKTMFLTTREVVRHMIAAKAGTIVNVGSLAGHRMLQVPVHYATAKAGVSGFTMSLARELARYGIRVNSIVPGLLDDGIGRLVPERELADYVSHCAAGRPGTPAEAAHLAAFLASDAASYINGQNILVDGGI